MTDVSSDEIRPDSNIAVLCDGGTGNVPEEEQFDTTEAEEQARYQAKVSAKAAEVYKEGTVFDYILESCEKRHVCTSDEERHVLEVLICSCASMQISNCCGINPNILGEAGVGKSDSANTVAEHYPPRYVIDGYLSKTALQHMTDMKPMTIILRDDQALTGDSVDIFNASLSKWDEDYTMRITNPKTHIVEPLKIPRRCARWTIYAHGTGNDQNHDRQIFLHPDASKAQRQSIHDKMADDVVDPFTTADNFSVDVSRVIWSKFIEHAPYFVQIPFARDIICDEGEGNRTFKMMLCLTMCFTIMAKEVREKIKSPDGKLEAYVATKDDFKKASKIMNSLIQGKGGSQKHKLTPTGEKVLKFLMYPEKEEFNVEYLSFRTVRSELGISMSSLSKTIDGLSEIVGIGIDNEGSPMAKNAKMFIVDRDAFKSWEGSQGMYVLKEDQKSSQQNIT